MRSIAWRKKASALAKEHVHDHAGLVNGPMQVALLEPICPLVG
jgi:hypothetical protein